MELLKQKKETIEPYFVTQVKYVQLKLKAHEKATFSTTSEFLKN